MHFLKSLPSSKRSEARARTFESQPIRSKRTLPSGTLLSGSCLAKRRKSGVQPPSELEDVIQSPGGQNIKDESCAETEDDEEPDDADEYDGLGIIVENIRIDDDATLWEFIDTRLKQMQQDACKKIAKDWIKAIEPQKQSKYPYNGGASKEESIRLHGDKNPGEFTKPPWWCSTQGWKEGEGCRHKEPDHQRKAGNAVPSSLPFGLLII